MQYQMLSQQHHNNQQVLPKHTSNRLVIRYVKMH